MAVARPAVDSAADGSEPSRTSQAVALLRAELPRLRTPGGDPDAQRRLCAGMRAAPAADQGPSIAARTRFFDGQVLAAICAGVRQIVILGSGYDDRALRFRSPGVRFIEIDHPATQADKASRLQAMNADTAELILAPADFRHDALGAVLAGCGHEADEPTLLACEGLLVYLDQQAIARLLGGLRTRACGGSLFAASLAVHRSDASTERVLEVANGQRRAAAAEPWRTILPADAHLRLIAGAGWHIGQVTDAAQLDAGVRPGRSLLVTARP
jgi:methyltransferase (TIGR00027 family)